MAHAKLQKKISSRTVGSFTYIGGNLTRMWDTELKGFCVQAYKTGRKVYVVGYTHGSRYRWYTIGKHGDPWTPEAAREKARSVLGRVSEGIDPALAKTDAIVEADKNGLTVSRLIDRYLEEGPIDKPDKRASSWANDKTYLNNHARRLLGRSLVASLRPRDISQFQNDVLTGKNTKPKKAGKGRAIKGGRGAAVHAVRSLSAALGWAVKRELVESNPCDKIDKLQDGSRERYLSFDEATRLFDAIKTLLAEEEITQTQVDCLHLLAYTAARSTEIKALKWTEVDFEKRLLILPPLRHKTGGVNKPKALAISKPSMDILMRRRGEVAENEIFVFPSPRSKTGHVLNVRHSFAKIKARAALEDFKVHDFRHAYASFAINDGASLKTIGETLGHKKTSTTERYAHLLVETTRPVVDGVANVYERAKSAS